MDWLETQYSLLHAMDTHDVDNLRTFGLQSGFQTLSLRRKVWPLLLKLDFNVHKWPSTPQTHTEVSNVTPLKSSKIGTVSPIKQPQLSPSLLHNSPRSAPSTSSTKNYAEQISLDIKRSFTQFPCLLNARTKSRKQKQLELILYEFYSTYTSLHYYQGWHDIGAVFLLLFNDMEVTKQALERVAIFYLRDAMHASLEPILFQMLFLLPILKREDRSLYHLFERTQLHPYFCLSWIITWYAHDLKDFECICRIFDFCLCTNPILPIYMSTAVRFDFNFLNILKEIMNFMVT
ncbi:hypothetical protein HMI54_012367 [Coelomomyces lativittatus]|nr:hypothetical protein HMI54_012367 [Coelomomyces lativittatus]